MADQLQSVSVAAPGFYGVNTQESGATLSSGFALSADNAVIDRYGRIGSRKGWVAINSSTGTLGTNDVTAIFEYVTASGSRQVLVTGNKRVFRLDGTSLTELYYDATLTDNAWQIVQLKDKCVFFQQGVEPLIYNGTTVTKISAASGYVATAPQAKIATAAFGRIWAANTTGNKVTLYWSDILNPVVWNTGTAGSLDLTTVFPNGVDEVMGIEEHNGFLVILCRKCVIVYQNASTPSSMSLSDVLDGIGCIASNSIQSTGSDIIFLSDRGVMTLGTLIQEKSMPQNDLSKNIRDDLLQILSGQVLDNIKSVYYEKEAFYLLTIPAYKQVYCFDMRGRLENGAARVTIWRNIVPTSFCVLRNRDLYMGFTGTVGTHTGYLDNGSSYRFVYYTNYFDFNDQAATTLKLLKKIGLVVIGGQNQDLVTKWAFDYSDSFQSATKKLPSSVVYEYGVSEYMYAEYNKGTILSNVDISQVGGSGCLVQVGVEAVINGSPLSIQKMDVFCKIGKMR